MRSRIESLEASAYRIPTDKAESDGTLEWNETTMVLVKVRAVGSEGVGYSYGHASMVPLIGSMLKPHLLERDVMDVEAIQGSLIRQIRNDGQVGLGMMAVSAVDIALWDLKAKLLGLPLCRLLGQERAGMQVYGSGGFTSYTDEELSGQLAGWARQGISAVKIKVGRDPAADLDRVGVARNAIGEGVGLFVDANGAYTVDRALVEAEAFSRFGVDWLEEPLPAEERAKLREVRQRVGARMRVVAGEYGYRLCDFRDLLMAGAVDVLQADATRCGGITGFLKAGHLAEAFSVPLSSHCAPAVHLHAALSLRGFSVAEYFHDHVRIEGLLFEGAGAPRDGVIYPDLNRPGLGLVLRERDAERYRVA
ncbi:MAG TPA: enolase C-terminal domain-like protein [Puia sp.]|jgi:L-alanine-DL-glutamate epimerase-like enolase superfamily enzyme|nr:enolase C-terminal domain-like protein [Puia sp.]